MRFRIAILFFLFVISILILSNSNTNEPYHFPDLTHFPDVVSNPPFQLSEAGVELGRFLFYDSILSIDHSISCGSCHLQKFAFSDAPNAFSKGVYGAKSDRNTLALFNLAWYPNLFWDGRVKSIEDQVFHPVRNGVEMNLPWTEAEKRIRESEFYQIKFNNVFGNVKIDSTLISIAISQFVRTLISYRSKYDKVILGEDYFTADEYNGFLLFNDMTKGNCLHCHPTDAMVLATNGAMSNNGLDEVLDGDQYKDLGLGGITGLKNEMGLFRVPSLRNLLYTAPYMHDGRFETIEDVLDFYSSGVKSSPTLDVRMHRNARGLISLNAEEKRQIICFLKTMSDSDFVNDKQFSNPFVK